MTFESQALSHHDLPIVALKGRIDSASSAEFEKALKDLFVAPGSRAVLDFSALDYISSAGLRVVLMAAKRAKQVQGRLLLCSLPAHVREVFEISGFLKIIDVVADRAGALQQLGA